MKKLLVAVVVLGLAAGCAKQAVKDQPKPGAAGAAIEDRNGANGPGQDGMGANGANGPGKGTPPQIAQAQPLDGQPAAGKAVTPGKDVAGPLAQRSVYFDFDSFTVKDDFKPVVQAHAKFVQDNPNAHVILQGNTDERGSREYNLALGQKRADAVRRLMQAYGANDAQIESISFGEEKPKNAGHDEEAWRENRRVDIVYKGE